MTTRNEDVGRPTLPSSGAMVRTLAGIAMLSGFLVVLVYQFTQPLIAENKRRLIERAVFKVIPGAASRMDFVLTADGLIAVQDASADGTKVYGGYSHSGELVGVALEAAGQGYQDVIRILYGYSLEHECITGIDILKSTETPGLGDKIGRDPKFLANFECLDGRVNAKQTALVHPIETVKHGHKSAPWQIDAISGATISSKAIGKMLNESGQKMFPAILKYRSELTEATIP